MSGRMISTNISNYMILENKIDSSQKEDLRSLEKELMTHAAA